MKISRSKTWVPEEKYVLDKSNVSFLEANSRRVSYGGATTYGLKSKSIKKRKYRLKLNLTNMTLPQFFTLIFVGILVVVTIVLAVTKPIADELRMILFF